MKRTILLASLLVAAGCASTGPPGNATLPAGVEPTHGMPPVVALLGHRAALELTSAQVVALDSIAEALHDGNEAVRQRLRIVLGVRGGGTRSPATEEEWMRARPHLVEISENNRMAMDAVAALLDPRQRQMACEIQGPGTVPSTGAVPPSPRSLGGRRAYTAPREIDWDVMLGYRVGQWSWCGAPRAPGAE